MLLGGKQLYVFACSQDVALNGPIMWTQTAFHGMLSQIAFVTVEGIPNLEIQSIKNVCETDSAVILVNGKASGQGVKWSSLYTLACK